MPTCLVSLIETSRRIFLRLANANVVLGARSFRSFHDLGIELQLEIMAEFAAVASGAGLASFGLQCCKGLAVYYSSYKAYDEQIRATHEEIDILTNLFRRLEHILSGVPVDPAQVSSVKQVEGILGSCRGRLQTLQDVLHKCQSITLSNTSSARLQRIKSQALFPFKEQTLLTLRENVHSLRENLQLALQVVHT